MEKTWQPEKFEKKVYEEWEKSGIFAPDEKSEKKAFVIPMPPPNVTGVLHAGHASMLAFQDILTRWHRMKGEPSLWFPGTDHAAIATQEVVERKLWKEEKKTRHDLGREKFLEKVAEFAEGSKNTILGQIKMMGASCDWGRLKYTMDETESKAVTEMFVRMWEAGIIYRGDRIVNWCPRCGSTLANDEVEHKEISGKLWHIKYRQQGDLKKWIEIATTRPETMFGDEAVAVHPEDERWKDWIGKEVLIPVIGRKIPVIQDKYVDREFGSGGLKVTPAHDPNDFEIGVRHGLKNRVAINEEGKMTSEAGKFEGLDRFECREKLLEELGDDLISEKEHEHAVGHCYRCKTVIEPAVSKQWWVDVKKEVPEWGKSLQEMCQDFVKSGKMKIWPKRFEAQYFNWVDNFRDWCISRQIWWGHRIPAWHCSKCEEIWVGRSEPEKCSKCEGKMKQDPDTLDTWFSSGLWTFGPLGWPEETEELKRFTTPEAEVVLNTGWDILTLWVVRMCVMNAFAFGRAPFQNVVINGLILDKNGKKMSKSRPETAIDPVPAIEEFGTDAFRLSLIVGGSQGNDLPLSNEKILGMRNFVNKLWNVSRFILGREDLRGEIDEKNLSLSQKWILGRLEEVKMTSEENLQKFKFGDFGSGILDFVQNDFADWFVEMAKVEEGSEPILKECLEEVLKLAHPIIPFVTEEIWKEGGFEGELISQKWPESDKKKIDQNVKKEMEKLQEVIKGIRAVRTEAKIEPGKWVKVMLEKSGDEKIWEENLEVIKKLGRCEEIKIGEKPEGEIVSWVAGNQVLHLVLEGGGRDEIKERLEKEKRSLEKWVTGLQKKLKGDFAKKAPENVVEKEKEKLKEGEEKLEKVKEQLKSLA